MAARLRPEHHTFAQDLFAEVQLSVDSSEDSAYLEEAFTLLVMDWAEEEGYWPDYEWAYHEGRGTKLNVWALDRGRGVLHLAVTDFEASNEARTCSRTQIDALQNRLQNFFRRCLNGGMDIAEYNPVSEVAELIASGGDDFERVELFVLTNRLTDQGEAISGDLEGFPFSLRIWDLETVRRAWSSGENLEPINVDFVERLGEGIPCLRAADSSADIETFLLFLPGTLLAELYQEYGPRLLERNVRAFLMARGKVNKGIRDTLRSEPEKFLSYNNGLTVTVGEVNLGQNGGMAAIRSVKDLQIVNGGQTTASIAAIVREDGMALSDVSVQVKLAHISGALNDEMVPKISRFANSQNAVSESDLAANNPYLRGLERISRTLWTPTDSGARPTKWYLERARGSYNVDKSLAGTPADQREFEKHYPKKQKFDKNQVALYENTWRLLPHKVCLGGQKNFVEFMLGIEESSDEGGEDPDYELIFRELVAKAILFKRADRLVLGELGGTYKRQVVAHTLAYLYQKSGHGIDLNLIWRTQEISETTRNNISSIAAPLREELIRSARDRNITEWAKKEPCWDHLRQQDFPMAEPVATSQRARSGGPEGSTRQRRQRPAAAAEQEMTLYECVTDSLGTNLITKVRRFQKRGWIHLGDTEIAVGNGKTYHLYRGRWTQNDGTPRDEVFAVNPGTRHAMPLERVPVEKRLQILAWLEELRG